MRVRVRDRDSGLGRDFISVRARVATSSHWRPLHAFSKGRVPLPKDESRPDPLRAHPGVETGHAPALGFGLLLPAGLRRLLEQNASERLELARHMDRLADGG